jgi:integrase
MGRRAAGEAKPVKRKDGRYAAYITTGKSPDGKQLRRWVYGRNAKEAAQKRRALLNQFQAGVLPEPHRMTVAQLLERHLSDCKPRVKETTFTRYRYLLDRYILPELGGVPLKKLSALQVAAFQAKIAGENGRTTASVCRMLLHAALERGRRLNLVGRNVVADVEPIPRATEEMRFWQPAEVRRFRKAVEGHRLEAFFVLSLSTGMRFGEVAGLRWSDLNPSSLTVRQIVTQGAHGRNHTGTPKTPGSARTISLDADTLLLLVAHRQRLEREREAAPRGWTEHGLVFPASTGRPLYITNVRKSFHLICKTARVPIIRLHDLRHTYASLAIASGMDVRKLANRLGHKRPSITLDTYSHLFELQREAAAVSLDRLLGSEGVVVSEVVN